MIVWVLVLMHGVARAEGLTALADSCIYDSASMTVRFSILVGIVILLPVAVLGQGTYYNTLSVSNSSFVSDLESRIRSPYTHVSYATYDETNVAQSADRMQTLRNAAGARLSAAQDTNMAEAISRMSKAQTAYQAALGAVGASSKLSLMDYIR